MSEEKEKPLRPFIDGRRSMTAKSIKELGESLNWARVGPMVRDDEKPTTWGRVLKALEKQHLLSDDDEEGERNPASVTCFEMIDRIVVKIDGESNWYEGRK